MSHDANDEEEAIEIESDDYRAQDKEPLSVQKASVRVIVGKHVMGLGRKQWKFDETHGDPDAIEAAAANKFIQDMNESIEGESADIFQVTSILRCPRYQHFPEADASGYPLVKCLLCAFIQTCVTPLVAVSQITRIIKDVDNDNFDICQQNGSFEDVVGKLVAFSFSAYIWILFAKEQRNNNDPGNAATFLILERNKIVYNVNGLIYIWGYCVNITSQFMTSLSATLLIFTAEDALNVILNALAVFFINEVDDILPTKLEYERAKILLERASNDGECESLVASDDLRSIGPLFKPFKWNGTFLSVVTFAVLTAAPFFMLACYGTDGK